MKINHHSQSNKLHNSIVGRSNIKQRSRISNVITIIAVNWSHDSHRVDKRSSKRHDYHQLVSPFLPSTENYTRASWLPGAHLTCLVEKVKSRAHRVTIDRYSVIMYSSADQPCQANRIEDQSDRELPLYLLPGAYWKIYYCRFQYTCELTVDCQILKLGRSGSI